MNLSYAATNAACNALVDLCDVGGAAKVLVCDGTQATNADTAIVAQNILATFTCASTAFGSASNGVATAAAISSVTAGGSGTATWFRVTNHNGSVVLWDGTVGAAGSGADMILSSTTISSGGAVSITSWTVTLPRA